MEHGDSTTAPGTPDLTLNAVQAHFAQSQSAHLLMALHGMDEVDRWALDYDENSATPEEAIRIRLFMSELGRTVEQGLPVLHRAVAPLMNLVAYLTTSRCIYLLRYAARHNPAFMECLAKLLEEQSGGVEANVIARRLMVFSKNEALARIFSPQSMERIEKIMKDYDD